MIDTLVDCCEIKLGDTISQWPLCPVSHTEMQTSSAVSFKTDYLKKNKKKYERLNIIQGQTWRKTIPVTGVLVASIID